MKILVVGGTGTISTDVTKLCIKKDFDITLLNRGNKPNRLPSGASTTQWVLDINNEEAVKSRMGDEFFDVVVNFINYTTDEIERDIRLFSGRTSQYIFISTASAYQKPRSQFMITESTPLSNPHWEYSRKKIACEDRLMQEYRDKGFPITIVRPSHTYDDYKLPLCIHGGKGSWSTLKRIQDGKPVLVVGDGNTLWPLTHSKDFAKAFVGLMGNVRAIGEAVHITTDEALTWNQIYEAIGSAVGVKPKLYHVATDFITAVSPSHRGPLHGDKSVTLLFDNSKIKRLVPGFVADIRFDQGVKVAVKNHLDDVNMQIDDPDFDRFTDAIVNAQEVAIKMLRERIQKSD